MMEANSVQPELNRNLFRLFKQYGGKKKEGPVEFFFYTDTEDKAANLVIELAKLGYEIYGIYPPEDNKMDWSITGATTFLCMHERELTAWCEKMNQLGFETDCRFDGWGTMIE